MTCVPTKSRKCQMETEKAEVRPHDDRGRHWSAAGASQEIKDFCKAPESRIDKTGFSAIGLGGSLGLITPWFWASDPPEVVRQYISFVSNHTISCSSMLWLS